MTKTKTCPNQNTIQKGGEGSPRKTQFIKFRATPQEKRELEIMCEILHINMSTLLRRCLCIKPVSSRKLGDDFSKENVLAVLAENTERKKTSRLYSSDPHPDRISRLIDIQAKLAAGKGAGYEHWAKIFNLKQMAKSMSLFTRYNLNSEEELNARVAELQEKRDEALKVVKDLEGRIKANQELSRHTLAYVQNKELAQQIKTAKNPETFREQHRAELTAYQAAAAYFKAQKITKLPSLKQLETEREQLISEKARFYEAYRGAKKAWIELSTAQQNLLSTLHREDRHQIQEGGLHDTDIAH